MESGQLKSEFRGWVVVYFNKPIYRGLDVYLRVLSHRDPDAKFASRLEDCTIFQTEEEANVWQNRYKDLGDDFHLTPEVKPIWKVTRLTLTNPEPGSVLNGLQDFIKTL